MDDSGNVTTNSVCLPWLTCLISISRKRETASWPMCSRCTLIYHTYAKMWRGENILAHHACTAVVRNPMESLAKFDSMHMGANSQGHINVQTRTALCAQGDINPVSAQRGTLQEIKPLPLHKPNRHRLSFRISEFFGSFPPTAVIGQCQCFAQVRDTTRGSAGHSLLLRCSDLRCRFK